MNRATRPIVIRFDEAVDDQVQAEKLINNEELKQLADMIQVLDQDNVCYVIAWPDTEKEFSTLQFLEIFAGIAIDI